MSHNFILDSKFFSTLNAIDKQNAALVQSKRCPSCGGRLDRADFPRKPRGGLLGHLGEIFNKRISLCCSREGCRKRLTPPSVLFLGRRVYLGVVMVWISIQALTNPSAKTLHKETGIAKRTANRWKQWWHTTFIKSPFFIKASAYLNSPLDLSLIPECLLDQFKGLTLEDKLISFLRFIMPLSTQASLK